MEYSALDTYIAHVHEAAELLTFLAAFIDDHGEVAPDDVNWSHVGSMSETVSQLRQVKNFITGEE